MIGPLTNPMAFEPKRCTANVSSNIRMLIKAFWLTDISNTGEVRAPKTVLGGVMTPSPIKKLADMDGQGHDNGVFSTVGIIS